MTTISLGSNTLLNCQTVLTVNKTEVFRLRRRIGDNQLIVDFEVRDKNNELISKIFKNKVVFSKPEFSVVRDKNFQKVVNSETGESIASVTALSPSHIALTGLFYIDGIRLLITEDAVTLPRGIVMSGNTFDYLNTAIVVNKDTIQLGAG